VRRYGFLDQTNQEMDGLSPVLLRQAVGSQVSIAQLHSQQSLLQFALALVIICTLFCLGLASPLAATPSLVIDAASGEVLYADQATEPWYPASLTKLMTVYVALKAVREHKISLETPLLVSARAVAMPPSKMGFAPGTAITLGNALKILMVKSANDVAVTVAEGISGSVEAFADEMNQAAFSLSLSHSHFVNPNGLPDPRHVSSARDMAVLARALYLIFPESAGLFSIGALQLGNEIIQNHNNLLGRYPGADGMKTGFTCAAGFNVVASATQNGHKYIAVVLGEPNVEKRTIKVAALFDRAFAGIDRPHGTVVSLQDNWGNALPAPHFDVCRNRKKAILAANAELDRLLAPLTAQAAPEHNFFGNSAGLQTPVPMALRISLVPPPDFDPQSIYLGAAEGYNGPIAQARPALTPIGTQVVPESLHAYAEPKTAESLAKASPLSPDLSALSLKIRAKTRTPHRVLSAKTKPEKIVQTAKGKPVPHPLDRHTPAKAKVEPESHQDNTGSE
jgi:D-alanyl-D-alanine carboxypeptidase